MKKNKYFIVPLLAGLVMITGCGKKKEENVTNNTTTAVAKQEAAMNIEEKDNRLYVNGKMVDFFSKSDLNGQCFGNNCYNNEDTYYCNGKTGDTKTVYEYKTVGSVLYVKVYPCNTAYIEENYFVDSNGQILKKINGNNADITLSTTDTFIKAEKTEENSIYLSVREKDIMLPSEAIVCQKKYDGKFDETAEYIDKITYENNEFKLEKAVETRSYEEYSKNHHINCSEKIEGANETKKVNGIDDYAAVIKGNKLMITDSNNILIDELATLDSENYKLEDASFKDTSDKLCNVTKAGIYIFVSNGLKGNDEKLYAIYYDAKKGEKSNLVMQNIMGEYEGVISCK